MLDGDIFGVAVKPEPLVTEEYGGSGVLGVGRQQPLQQPSSSSSKGGKGGGVQHLVWGGLGGGTQSSCRGGVGNGGWQASLGQKGVSTHPFDPEKSKGVTMMPMYREGRRSTAVGEMSVKERGYVVEHEVEQGDGSNSSISTSSSKSLDETWDGTSSFPFDRGKTPRALPRHVFSSVAWLDS